MKIFYTAYAKTINDTTFYFVKSFQTFPEYQNVPPILETFGMHTSFIRACKIANIFDNELQQRLLNELENNTASSKVLPLYPDVAEIYNLKRKHTYFPSLLKLIGLG